MKRRRQNHHSNHERWLVSYADFITLLFAFFVVLYASSRADIRKQAQVAQSIHSAFTALGLFPPDGHGKGAGSVAVPPQAKDPVSVEEDLARIKKQLSNTLSKELAAHTVALQLGPNGLVISLREAGFYHSGSAQPRISSIPTIAKIAQQLRPTPYALRIEGHTDNIPIHTSQYNSNWELSTARATYLTRLFIRQFQMNPARLSAAGYAQYHPIASNATAAGRAENRRVDIIVLPHGYNAQPHLATPINAIAAGQNPPAPKEIPSASRPAIAAKSHPPSPGNTPAIASSQKHRPSPYQ
ncbi:MAG: flagellar motor protein MotB [Acidobacteriaceae bacterium]